MKKRSREINQPDLTPLIDVVFLLLIFFMVSTVFKKDEFALMLNLPKTSQKKQQAGSQKKKKSLNLELSENKLAMDGKEIQTSNLKKLLLNIEDKKMVVNLRIDKLVKYENIVTVLDALKSAKLNNISLITINQK